MYDLAVTSNFHILTREMQSWAVMIPKSLDRACRAAAEEFVRDCKKELDELVYSQPEGEYHRTRKLRNGHKITKLGEGNYLITNVMDYHWWVHEGYHDQGGNWHPGKPWMDICIIRYGEKYHTLIGEKSTEMFK